MGLPLLMAFVACPILYDVLGVAKFGLLTLAWALVGYLSVFDLGLGRAMMVRLGDAPQDANVTIAAGLRMLALLGLAMGLGVPLLVVVLPNLDQVLSRSEVIGTAIVLGASVPLITTTSGLRAILESQHRFIESNLARLVVGVSMFGLPLLLLDYSQRLDIMVASMLLGRLLSCVGLAWCTRDEVRQALVQASIAKEARTLLQAGGWLSVSNVASLLMVYADRFLLAALGWLDTIAYYTTPHEVVSRLFVVPAALTNAFFPRLVGVHHQDREQEVVRGMTLTLAMMLPLSLGLSLFAYDILALWLSPAFAENAYRPMQLIGWGVLINSVAQFPFWACLAAGQQRNVAIVHLVELPLYALVLAVLAAQFGIVGAAIAWLLRVSADLFVMLGLVRFADRTRRRQALALALVACAAGILPLLAAPGSLRGANLKTTSTPIAYHVDFYG